MSDLVLSIYFAQLCSTLALRVENRTVRPFQNLNISRLKIKKIDRAFLCATSLVTFTDMNAICPKARRGNVHFLVKISFLTSALKIFRQINKE